MSLKLFVDECCLNKLFIQALIDAGHDVQTVSTTNLIGKSDNAVFEHAIAEDRIVVTHNCADFQKLSEEWLADGKHHPGIFLVYLYNNPKRDLSFDETVKAIANFESTGVETDDQTITINQYHY